MHPADPPAENQAAGAFVSLTSSAQVPLISEVDLLVIGGGLAGLAAAHQVADQGRRTLVVECGTFLGYELAGWQRPWVRWRSSQADLLRAWLPLEDAAATAADGQIIPLNMDQLKLKLENRLLEAGVRLLYASRPVGCRRDGPRWIVTIGNKSGRQAVAAQCIVDASETGVMQFLAGSGPAQPSGAADTPPPAARQAITVRRTVEFTGVSPETAHRCHVPPGLAVVGDSVTIYPGGFSPDHVYVDVPVRVEAPTQPSLAADCDIEFLARAKSLEVAEYLVRHIPAFAKAKLGLGSLQVMRGDDFDPAAALRRGVELGRQILTGDVTPDDCYLVSGAGWRSFRLPAAPPDRGAARTRQLILREESEFAGEWPGPKARAPVGPLEVLADVDVAVVGGGTSGATAARVAAAEGARTALVEMNPGLGGTGTYGSIRAYWMTAPDVRFSSPNAFSDELDRRVAVWETRVGYPRRPWTWVRKDREGRDHWWGEDATWSIEVKAQVLLEMCREAGAAVFLNTPCIGALVEGDRVVGLVVATPYGPRAVLGTVTIDATGDGDVAAFAGAPHVYGNERDRLTMWACLPFYREPGELGSHFTSTVDVGDIFDYTRFILTNRRRGGRLHDHGTYIAPRESRHIRGDALITLHDQLLLARYPDTVAVLFSNYDMKGGHVADLVDFGINPPHVDIEIPYRALLPQSLGQLLIAGKAFSLTHDASAAPRMQRDLQLLGGALGMAAALAVADGVDVKALSVAKLQQRLAQTGNLPERVLGPRPPTTAPCLEDLVAALTGDEPFEWLEMLATERVTTVPIVIQLCCAGSADVVPLLRQALDASQGKRRLLLARLLLWHRCEEGLAPVLEEIDRQWRATDSLPECTRDLWWVSGAPEQGIMPEIVYLLHAATRAGSPSVVPAFEEVVRRVETAPRDYADDRTRVFDYLHAVSLAAERLPIPEFVPLLHRLLRLPELRDSLRQPTIETDHLEERKAYLVLCLARALARCGRKEGLLELAELLSDDRAVIAKSAYQELRALTALDHPRSPDLWRTALEAWPQTFPPQPWTTDLR